jgi:hypothetical protein
VPLTPQWYYFIVIIEIYSPHQIFSVLQQTNNALKIFEGTNVCWIGINDEEVTQMNEILTTNGGSVTRLDDPNCTHVVSFMSIRFTMVEFYEILLIGNRPPWSWKHSRKATQ